MNTKTTPKPRVPRASLSDRIGGLPSSAAKTYATFIRSGEADGPIPCWGGIAERFVEAFPTDRGRISVLEQLVAEGDPRPLYLFLDANRDRPKVLEALVQRLDKLPESVQRGLVAMPETESLVAASLDTLTPTARRVWEGGEALKYNERELFAGRVGKLMSFRYFVPDAFDPRHESSVKAGPPVVTK